MTNYIHDDFLLNTQTGRTLYHDFASSQPIIDYHCHLSPADLAQDRQFDNLFDVWLAGDHYKWRAMRSNGEDERLCTGDAEPYEKFLAFARTVPVTLRNPLYHWTHLELKRYFGIDTLLNEQSAPEIWEQANDSLASGSLSAWGILEKFKVQVIGTTDDPTDDLAHHQVISSTECPATVLPTFRPDKGFCIDQTDFWNAWVNRLAERSGHGCEDLSSFLGALEHRIELFDRLGCAASDHGIESCPATVASESQASRLFEASRRGKSVTAEETQAFTGFLLCWLGERYAEHGWAMQLHLGAIRNVNRGLFSQLGPDVGCDSIHDVDQVQGVATIMGELSARGKLPKTILYNLDPAKNYALASMCGNFSQAGMPGKVQFGSGWWFLDQLEGMTWQINAISNLGLLAHFIGMLTDSRSFMSYPRHEYFRRMLCNLLGSDVENGLVPTDMELLGNMVEDISYRNAARFLDIQVPAEC